MLRHKFFALLEGYVATDEECLKLLDQQDGAKAVRPFARRPRPGKHNMAKGAMPVEDAAVRQRPVVLTICADTRFQGAAAARNTGTECRIE